MENEVQQVRGVVVATAQNAPNRYGIRIGELWFDGYGECPVERGQEVEIEYAVSGNGRTFRNVQAIRVVEPAEDAELEGSGGADPSVDARIVRCVALKAAATVNSGSGEDPHTVLEDAEIFERWLRAI